MIPDINLMPGQLAKQESGSKLLYIILSAIGVVILLVLIFMYIDAKKDIKTLQSEETTLQQKRDNLKAELDTLAAENTGTLEYSVLFVESVSYAVSPIIDEIQKLQPKNAYFRSYTFDQQSVTITFDIETLNEVAQFISKLNASSYFTDVQVQNVDQQLLVAESESKVNFNEVPRQATELQLFLNHNHLATGGAR